MRHASLMDPWSCTLAMLDDRASRGVRSNDIHGSRNDAHCARSVNIRLVERLSESTLALSWHDPTSFNYSEQVWALCTARKRGVCVLSGETIRRGQPVYRPRRVGSCVPLNSGAMILAFALAPWDQESHAESE